MDYLNKLVVRAPLEPLEAVDRSPLRDAQKNVLYGVIDLTFNSLEQITVKTLSKFLDMYPPLTTRYLNDLLAYQCIFRIKRKKTYVYFLNENYDSWKLEKELI